MARSRSPLGVSRPLRYIEFMHEDVILRDGTLERDVGLLGPAALRLARGVPEAREILRQSLTKSFDRALAGLEEPPDFRVEADPGRAALAALCAAERCLEGGKAVDLGALRALEDRLRGAGDQVLVAQARVLVDPDREREARRALASQDLPYVMPGVIHPLQVEILAAGDRVLPALHVDHVRKLTVLVAEILPLDARAVGLWFWPVLRALAPERLRAPLSKLPSARRLPPGGRGLAAAYLSRLGGDVEAALVEAGPADRLLAALAVLGDRSDPP